MDFISTPCVVATLSRYIEETLKEAHDSASMLAVGDNNVIRAYTGGKYTAVITYEDRHIISIQSM